MDNLIQSSISRSIGNVWDQIAEVDGNLAVLFRRIAEILHAEKRRRKESEQDDKRINESIVKGIFDKIGIGGAINTFPFGEPGDCLEECLVMTFGILNSKYGFNQVVDEVKNYWLNCGMENCRTLI